MLKNAIFQFSMQFSLKLFAITYRVQSQRQNAMQVFHVYEDGNNSNNYLEIQWQPTISLAACTDPFFSPLNKMKQQCFKHLDADLV